MEIIFERFRQVDFSLSRKYEGAGLGLAIADGIVKLLGGKIGANSKLNKGSEFFFTVPYEHVELSAESTTAINVDPLKNKRIVVVDDDEHSYSQTEIILFQNEVDVWHAKNQNMFYEFISAKANKIDVIVLNMQTKWLKGCPSIQKIKSINSRASVLLILDELDNSQKEECIAAGEPARAIRAVPVPFGARVQFLECNEVRFLIFLLAGGKHDPHSAEDCKSFFHLVESFSLNMKID